MKQVYQWQKSQILLDNNANETTKGSKGNTKNQKIFGSNKGHFVMYRGRGRRQFL